MGSDDERTRSEVMRRAGWQFIKLLVVVALWAVVVWVAFGSSRFRQLLYPIHYAGMIATAAKQEGLDPFIVAAVIRTESRFRPSVVSSRGAQGLMQIMPDTGRWAAAQLGIEPYSESLLREPATNIRIGSWYLRRLIDQYRGDVVIALAAYNGGPSNVDRWLSEGRWSGKLSELSSIPFAETAEYVRRVTQAHRAYVSIYAGRFPSGK